MSTQEFGEQLRMRREAKGLSIADVSERTKIHARHIRAIEEGRFELLPGIVYAKAFVRHYARAVGEDPDEVAAQFSQVIELQGEPVFAVSRKRRRSRRRARRAVRFPWPWVAVIVLLAALGYLVAQAVRPSQGPPAASQALSALQNFALFDALRGEPEPAQEPVPGSEDAGSAGWEPQSQPPAVEQDSQPQPESRLGPEPSLEAGSAPESGPGSGTAESEPGSEAESDPGSEVESDPGSARGSEPESGPQAEPGTEPAEPSAPLDLGPDLGALPQDAPAIAESEGTGGAFQIAGDPTPDGMAPASDFVPPAGAEAEVGEAASAAVTAGAPGVVLVVDVREACWFRVEADGRLIFMGEVGPGETRTWVAQEALQVRYGRPEGVFITLNGTYLGRAGTGVITRVYRSDGVYEL